MRGVFYSLAAAIGSLQLVIAKPLPKASVVAVSLSTVTKTVTSEIDTPFDLTFSTHIKYATTLTISGYTFTVTDIPIQEHTSGISTKYTVVQVKSVVTVSPNQATATAKTTTSTSSGKSATATCAPVQGWASDSYFDSSIQLGETQVTSADDCYLHCKATTGCVAFEYQPATTDSDNCWFYAKSFTKYVTQDITGLYFYDATCYGYTGSSTPVATSTKQTTLATSTRAATSTKQTSTTSISSVVATSTCGATGSVSADFIQDCVQDTYTCDALECSILASKNGASAWSIDGNNCTLWNTPYESYFTASSKSTQAFSDVSCPILYQAPATNHTYPANATCAAQGDYSNETTSSWKASGIDSRSLTTIDQCAAFCLSNPSCVLYEWRIAPLTQYLGPDNCVLFATKYSQTDVYFGPTGLEYYYDRACAL